jgi:hypothetical protein
MPTSDRSSVFVVLAASALAFGCGGGATVEAQPPPGPQGAAPPPSAAAAAGPMMPVTATINGVAVSNKGDHFTRVTITFKNPGGVPCKVTGYTFTWGGGKKTIGLEGANFVVAPGASEVRAIRVHPSDGDLTVLISPDGAKVDLESSCG